MKQIILGTAGHIDHGKTSLIKALTGIDTDRLKEEKLRGITIELGFASLDLPSGQHLGIVDVPGHEKFVKNMVAGATGIDIVTMVIAADEGVMPQTREHMEICTLLGINHGFVVLTKSDLVDEEWLELVTEDVREFTRGTFLEDKPMVPVSSVTGQGIPEFLKILDETSTGVPPRSSAGIFRLPVDRVFTMKGFGTVITGTLVSGNIRVGDTIMVYPSAITSKVRGIQVHNQSVNSAEAGMRTAINFQGLERASVSRGNVLARPGDLKSSYMVDISFHFLGSNKKRLKNRTLVRLHTGTSEVLGNLVLLDTEELLPGTSTIVQLRLDSPVVVVKDDRFVIRSYSPVRTIGGGHVVNPIPIKHKRFKPDVTEGLKGLSDSTPEDVIAHHAVESLYKGVTFSDLKIMTNMPDKQLDQILQDLLSKRTIILVDKENRIFIHHSTFEKLKQEFTHYMGNYHRAKPLKAGMPKEELKTKLLSAPSSKLFNMTLIQMIKDRQIIAEENIVRLASHRVSLAVDQSDIRQKILKAYKESGLTPPYFRDLSKTMGVDPTQSKDVLMLLIDEGLIVKVKEDLYFHTAAIDDLKKRLVTYLENHEEITTPQLKDMTGVSRKYLIPLIEHFDAKNITLRVGDTRRLRRAAG